MQMYSGLDIVTNKIPEEERRGIPHHLLGSVAVTEEPWVVGRYVHEASNIIREIRDREKVPILVGGTHFYLQSLLFEKRQAPNQWKGIPTEELERRWPILKGSVEEMLEALKALDPAIAARWHPKDGRKIRRSLEICLTTGERVSEIYAKQASEVTPRLESEAQEAQDSSDGHEPQSHLQDALVIWLHADPEALKLRLDTRVLDMMASGLLEEIEYMDKLYHRQDEPPDLTHGIWASIGFKEFSAYLTAVRTGASSEVLQTTKAQGIELTQIATRQYAKSQVRWLKFKLLPALRAAHAAETTFLLDATDPTQWTSRVEQPALDLTARFLANDALPAPLDLVADGTTAHQVFVEALARESRPQPRARRCEACAVTLMTEEEWEIHPRGRKHRAMLRRLRHVQWARENGVVLGNDEQSGSKGD